MKTINFFRIVNQGRVKNTPRKVSKTFCMGAINSLFGLMIWNVGSLQASQGYIGQEADLVLNSHDIDVDGKYHKRSLSEAEKRRLRRQELENENEDLVLSSLEKMREEEEKKIAQQIKNNLKGNPKPEKRSLYHDSVDTHNLEYQNKASRQAVSKANLSEDKSDEAKPKNRIAPTIGLINIQAEGINVESDISFGLQYEVDYTENFSFGVGFRYATTRIVGANSQFWGVPNWSMGFGAFNQFRQMDYDTMGLDFFSKFYFFRSTHLNPYIGLGMGWTRDQLGYSEGAGNFQHTGMMMGNERYLQNYMMGSVMTGVNIQVMKHFHIDINMRYARGLFDPWGVTQTGSLMNINQVALNQLGERLSRSHFLSAHLGLGFNF